MQMHHRVVAGEENKWFLKDFVSDFEPKLKGPRTNNYAEAPLTSSSSVAIIRREQYWWYIMPRYKDEPPAVRVYTVCDESRYLIVRNVPSLGCGDELLKLFSSYGDVEECKPMDAEDCEQFTDVYWIKFRLVSNARFAKRKLDEYVFLGNRLGVSYAPDFESLTDTKDKLEGRRREVLARLNPCRSKGSRVNKSDALTDATPSQTYSDSQLVNCSPRDCGQSQLTSHVDNPPITRVSSEKEYFASPSMNQTVQMVWEKLDKIQSSSQYLLGHTSKKARVDNRRRI